jgi:hypothetical protein
MCRDAGWAKGKCSSLVGFHRRIACPRVICSRTSYRSVGAWYVAYACPLGLFLDAEDKAVRSFETSVNFCRTTSNNITLCLTVHLIALYNLSRTRKVLRICRPHTVMTRIIAEKLYHGYYTYMLE